MRRALALWVTILILTGCSIERPHPAPSTSLTGPTAGPDVSVGASPTSRVRPRRELTPGVVDPRVTQATIHSTICVAGWSARQRPSSAYTTALKKRQITQYGYADTNPADYEEDHLIPLELGGAPRDPLNLWPEPGPSPNAKDADENRLHADVCATPPRLTLDAARAELLATWGPTQ